MRNFIKNVAFFQNGKVSECASLLPTATVNNEKPLNRNSTIVLCSKTGLSGEVFKERFIDILNTNIEQVAFSLKSTKVLVLQASNALGIHGVDRMGPTEQLFFKFCRAKPSANPRLSFVDELCFILLAVSLRGNPRKGSKQLLQGKLGSKKVVQMQIPSRAQTLFARQTVRKPVRRFGQKAVRRGKINELARKLSLTICNTRTCAERRYVPNKSFALSEDTPILLNKKIGDYLSSGDKIGHLLSDNGTGTFCPNPLSRKSSCLSKIGTSKKICIGFSTKNLEKGFRGRVRRGMVRHSTISKKNCTGKKRREPTSFKRSTRQIRFIKSRKLPPVHRLLKKGYRFSLLTNLLQHCKAVIHLSRKPKACKKSFPPIKKKVGTPIILNSSGRIITISKTQLILQKTQPVLFYNSANLHVKKGEWVKEGSPILTLTHQTLITGDIVQGIPRIEQLSEAFTSPPSTFKDKERAVTKFKDVHDTLHSQVRDIFRKHWFKSVLPIAVRKSLEEIQYILVESIQKVYLSQGVLIADKHIEIIIRQIASKGQILDSGTTGLFLEEILPIRHIENANLATPGKKCLYVPAVVGLTAAALSSDSFISAASFQETTRVLSRDAVVGKSDFLRGLKEKVVIGDLISAGTGLDIYFIYTTMMAR